MQRSLIRPAAEAAASFARFLRRFRREDGAVAIWFAVLALPLAILAFGLVDVNRAAVEKRHLQDALDAATLLAARSNSTTDAQMQTIGSAALTAQMTGSNDATLTSTTFTVSGIRITGKATATVTPIISNLWLRGDMQVAATSEVVRSSTNLEVAMVLDITGSMSSNGKIEALRTAAADLVTLVVQDVQTPYYTKMAVVPFSVGVNAGDDAGKVRGVPAAAAAMSGAVWQTASKSITGVSRANPAVVTSSSHGLQTGDTVYFSGVSGMTQLNGNIYTVTRVNSSSFRLNNTNSSNYTRYDSGGVVWKCSRTDCATLVTTTSNHNLATGDPVTFVGVKGMTQLNGVAFTATKQTNTTFTIPFQPTSSPTYTSSGSVYCAAQGCEYFAYQSSGGSPRVSQITTCVTERVGPNATNDVSSGTAFVGRHYGTGCPSAKIQPLTSNKDTLTTLVSNLPATGATAGQIGIAWGWYMISPNFGSIWSGEGKPAAYTAPKTLKVVIFMTDGEFNTSYCDGVLSTSTNGCNANNSNSGTPTEQAQAICTAMKTAGVVIYTVGFDVGSDATAKKFVEDCATSTAHVYLPSGGGALRDAFAAIGRDIMKLRLAK